MRCPYCGGLNSDQAQFCVRCGRDMSKPPVPTTASRTRAPYPPPPQQQPPYQNPRQPAPGQAYPGPATRPTPGTQVPSSYPPPKQGSTAPTPRARRVAETPVVPVPVAPEAPAPFPPRTMQQLKTLEQGALNYSLVSEEENVGRKKTIRILYQRCVPWQQVATLLKALKDHQAEKFNTIIIQGVYGQDNNVYGFTNGQLQFDRNVRLGSQTMNRYQLETGNGFETDSVRIVLSE